MRPDRLVFGSERSIDVRLVSVGWREQGAKHYLVNKQSQKPLDDMPLVQHQLYVEPQAMQGAWASLLNTPLAVAYSYLSPH